MEESLSLLGAIRKKFVCDRVDIRTYSPLTLAFVGDCIYDLVIRTIVVERGNTAPGVLHTKKSSIVKAQAQAAQADALMEFGADLVGGDDGAVPAADVGDIVVIVPIGFALVLIRYLEIFYRIFTHRQVGLGLADEAGEASKLAGSHEERH